MTSDKLTLGLDVDGVLLDYKIGFLDYMRTVGVTPACEPHEVATFSFSNAFPDVAKEVISGHLRDFIVHDGFGRLPPHPGAVDAINSIKAEFADDIRIVAITSAGSSEETLRLRKQNLEVFPLDEVTVLPLGADKTEHLARLGSRAIYIDDLYSHVLAAESVGVRGILYRQLYNAADNHSHVMSDWDENGSKIVMNALAERIFSLRFSA